MAIETTQSYYNSKLLNLIKEARKDGIELSNEIFVKTAEEKFPVMEVFFVNNTTYEDFGRFNIYKRTVKISQEDYDEIVAYAKKNDCKNIKCNYNNGDELIERIIYNNDESGFDFSLANIGGNIEIRYNNYRVYSDKDECVDLLLTKENDDDDFPRGYVSFYIMNRSDFEESERVSINLEKFMRDNK